MSSLSPRRLCVAVLSLLAVSAGASAQIPALAQLAAQAGPNYAAVAVPAPPSAVPPPGGFEQQNQAWNELVRPLVALAQQMDRIDRSFDEETRTLLGRTTPGLSMWGKDVADRLSLKGQISIFVDAIKTEQRNKTAAYGLAWRLYGPGSRHEIDRLDAQGQALVRDALARLTASEKDPAPVVQKLTSLRTGQPGLIARALDSSIASGLDATLAGDREIRRYTNGIRQIIGQPGH